ncbi:MAG: hypothetical protein J6X71_09280 [Bacteroidales bacterium]|nr:hypothetical protein [Bacteroidales bacterium]
MKKTILAILLVLLSMNLPAQTKRQSTESYMIQMYDSYPDYSGTLTYSYIVDDDGNRIKNGPISIKGSLDDTYGTSYIGIRIKGSYTLSGACKDDKMDGPFSVSAKYHFDVKKGSSKGSYDEEYKMKGAFVDGLPNGNFTASITDVGTVNVNYDNGVLVGSYFVDAQGIKAKGNLDKNGQLTGTWDYNDSKMEFLNGVLVHEIRQNWRTVTYKEASDSQIEIAKQYATGAITEEDLREKGAIVEDYSLSLYTYPREIFCRKRLVDWDYKMGLCNFGTSNSVKYKQLAFMRFASESDLDIALAEYREEGKSDKVKFYDRFKRYIVNYYDSDSRENVSRLLSDGDIAKIKEAVDKYNRSNAINSLEEFLSSSSDSEHIFDNRYKLMGLAERFDELKKESDISRARQRYGDMVSILDQFDTDLVKLQKTEDGQFYIIPYRYQTPFRCRYLTSSAIDEFISTEKEIRDYSDKLEQNVEKVKAEEEARRLEKERLAEEARRAEKISNIRQVLQSRLDRIVGKKESDFRLLSDVSDFCSDNGGVVGAEEFKRAARRFLPLIEYQIESIDIDNVSDDKVHFVAVLTVQRGKKTIKYRLPMVARERIYEIYLSSFNIKNAQEIE